MVYYFLCWDLIPAAYSLDYVTFLLNIHFWFGEWMVDGARKNAVLIDRLRMLLVELDYAERELGQSRQRAPLNAQRQTEPNRLREVILCLERLAAMLERLCTKASGKTQLLIKKLEVEAGEVVNLLVGGSAPSGKGPS